LHELTFLYSVYINYNGNIRGRVLHSEMSVILRDKISASADDI
jgi:hypothetical protein